MWAVSVAPGSSFEPGLPERLLDDRYSNKEFTHTGYDVAPDGRLLVMGRSSDEPEALTVVLNWFEELTALVPVR